MGRMKELSTQFIGYTVVGEIYFENKAKPEHCETFIEPENLTADTVKSVINMANNGFKTSKPNKATLHIYKTYGDNHDYAKFDRTFELTGKQCKNAWT